MSKRVLSIKEDFQAVNPKVHVEWEKATLIMDPRPGVEVLFLYAGMPGAFRALIRKRRFGEGGWYFTPSLLAPLASFPFLTFPARLDS